MDINTQCDLIIDNVKIASMQDNQRAYGVLDNACVAIQGGKIVYLGMIEQCPFKSTNILDGKQQWLLPGLIDCHTHMVHGGDRANEFEQRLNGVSYADIARNGGGIQSTVNATRQASEDELLESALKRAKTLLSEGVTTVEIKSGYGLDQDTEMKMLRVAKRIAEILPIHVTTTYLGAHAVPKEYSGSADRYLDLVCQQVMPAVAAGQLADSVDVFCESIGFNLVQTERVLQTAKQLGLSVKAHVEQLSDMGGAKLACQYQALSVDHVEYLSDQDVIELKRADTVAVMLPGAFYFLNETQKPPIQLLREHRVPMAVATDLNPGSSPVVSLLTAMNMACVLFAMTPEEVIAGATKHAAKALGLNQRKGVIDIGYDADLTLWDIAHPGQLVHAINHIKPSKIWIGGESV